jgi:hypothetical protein
LRDGPPEELADIFEAFDVSAIHDKRDGKLQLAPPSRPNWSPKTKNPERPWRRREFVCN